MKKTCLLITTFNRGSLLRHSLKRLSRLTLPDEILIVDDGSTDNTEEVVLEFQNLPIRYIYNHNPEWSICSYARNIGVKNTDCEIIITAEPELFFITDVVAQMLENHEAIPNHLISAGTIYHQGHKGVIRPNMYDNPFADTFHLTKAETSTNNPNPNDPRGYVKIQGWQATYTALYRKEWLEAVGGWDEQFPACYGVDDIDVATRIRILLGVNQVIQSDIAVIHQWHPKPPQIIRNATQKNMDYFHAKNLSVNGNEDITNPNLIANRNIEWGVIK